LLGISYGFHDSAIVLLHNGEIKFAAQEERFTRVKHDPSFPINALKKGLDYCGITISAVEDVFYYENSETKFERICETYRKHGFTGRKTFFKDYPAWKEEKSNAKNTIANEIKSNFGISLPQHKIHYVEHHLSHAASAFYPSPYKKSAILCIDGVGEWATTSAWLGNDSTIEPVWEIRFPHSLGLLYSAFTQYCGFKVDSGEYKLMGLAPYGEPKYADIIRKRLIDVKPDGSFQLNMYYFDYEVGSSMINERFESLFEAPARESETEFSSRHFDLAASVQQVVEETVFKLATGLQKELQVDQLCLAGGVALNCVANGKLARQNIFKDIWIQPASGDCGGSLGAALYGWYENHNGVRETDATDSMKSALLGTEYSSSQTTEALTQLGAIFTQVEERELLALTSTYLADGNVIGWFQGRMEFGPRALGGRSILGDPRVTDMQTTMNLKIKYRESFRPFAPMVLESEVKEWFDYDRPSPYMLIVADVQENKRLAVDNPSELTGLQRLKQTRSVIPAVTHVDSSARIQTVTNNSNPRLHKLLEAFHERTGCPILINTSFNVRGEPIVESIENAYMCFMRTEMDYLVVNNCILRKQDQPQLSESNDWRTEFALD